MWLAICRARSWLSCWAWGSRRCLLYTSGDLAVSGGFAGFRQSLAHLTGDLRQLHGLVTIEAVLDLQVLDQRRQIVTLKFGDLLDGCLLYTS